MQLVQTRAIICAYSTYIVYRNYKLQSIKEDLLQIRHFRLGDGWKSLLPLFFFLCISTTCDHLYLSHTNSPQPNLKKICVYIKVTGKNVTISVAPLKSSGFVNAKWGVLPHVQILQEPSGANCQHLGHLGGARNLGLKGFICHNCTRKKDNGTPPIKSLSTVWTLQKLKKIRSTRPIFFVVLVSRCSCNENIPNSMFTKLKETIIKNERYRNLNLIT